MPTAPARTHPGFKIALQIVDRLNDREDLHDLPSHKPGDG